MEHKIKQKWQQRAVGIHDRFMKLAQAKGGLNSEPEVLHFLTLAICGEAGELANLVKKMWRGDEVDPEHIRDEIADIRIYLEHISRHLDIDLDKACERKLDEVHKRLVVKENHEEAGLILEPG
jgi:NTP pyrophosphatase (non-canonical NTP hydrolase)